MPPPSSPFSSPPEHIARDAEVLNALVLEQAGIMWGTTTDGRILMSAADWDAAEQLNGAIERLDVVTAPPKRLPTEPSYGISHI